MSLIGVSPAQADPGSDPTSSKDAKQAWQDSSHQAEIAAEALNGARVDQRRAEQRAAAAEAAVVTAKAQVRTAQGAAASSAATVARYQAELDRFANASFRGAQLNDMSALLTADSADDFLDQATAIDRVADDTQRTLEAARTAQAAAATARDAATAAEARAEQARTAADTAAADARGATTAATQKKSQLDGAVAKYKKLYAELSEKERLAAIAAAEKARRESEEAAARAAALAQQQAAERAARQAAEAPAAPAAGTGDQDGTDQDGTDQDGTDQNGTDAQDGTDGQADAQDGATAGDQGDGGQSADGGTAESSTAAKNAVGAAPAAVSGGDKLGQIAAQAAMTKIGGGYCYACDGPDSFDCSGLTTWAWGQAGISIPRVSYEQANFPEVPLDQLQPGDLVTYYSPVSHVAIYVGNGMVVSAADESLGIIYVPVDRGGPNPTGHRVPRG
ncbi:hypothetical protein GCM10011594_35720 [Nakamurella endophytica]|uniref:NlpC/P60 domain-containing protein n=1 Tax=Nakamurella endophytica TaxID=1748367 RepID=A0A917T7J9_9ACTN|nr:hypothetical protein GCM10011594_35720 [Nakamurella endophytica]